MIPETSKKHLWALPITLVVFLVLELTGWLGWNDLYFNDEWFGWEFTIDPFYGQFIFSTVIIGLLAIGFEIQQRRKQDGNVPIADSIADVLVTMASCVVAFLIVKTFFLFL
jgi:hypothetical protein